MTEEQKSPKPEMAKSRGFLKVRPTPVMKDFKDLRNLSWTKAPEELRRIQGRERSSQLPPLQPAAEPKKDSEKPSAPRGSKNTEAQDEFFRQLSGEGITVHFHCFEGYQPRGRIRSIDTYGIIIETSEGPELLFKHGIISVKPVQKK